MGTKKPKQSIAWASLLAERVGFEPTVQQAVHRISNPAHSTTLTPLLNGRRQSLAGLRGEGGGAYVAAAAATSAHVGEFAVSWVPCPLPLAPLLTRVRRGRSRNSGMSQSASPDPCPAFPPPLRKCSVPFRRKPAFAKNPMSSACCKPWRRTASYRRGRPCLHTLIRQFSVPFRARRIAVSAAAD